MRVAISVGHGFNRKGDNYQFDPGYVNEEHEVSESAVVSLCGNLLLDIFRYSGSIDITLIPRCCLQERISIINALHQTTPFDLAIEIHLNAFRNHKVRGTEAWYNPNRPESKEAAGNFAHQISRTLRSRNRGAKSSTRLAFVRDVIPTPVLTEADFLSNGIVAGAVKDFLIPQIAWGHALAIWGLNLKGARR